MLCSLSAHRLGAIADTASKQTAPESPPQCPRGNGPITPHAVPGWDGTEWDYAMRLPWRYFWAQPSARCQWPGLEQMSPKIRRRGVCVCVFDYTHTHTRFSLTSLAPRPKSLRPSVNSLSPLSIASGPHAQTRTHTLNTHMLQRYNAYTWSWLAMPSVHNILCIHVWPLWYVCTVQSAVLYIQVFNSSVDTVNQSN